MRSESEVTVFGRSLIVRRYQPLFAFVLLGLWVATIVPTGEWWLLPYLSVVRRGRGSGEMVAGPTSRRARP